MKRLALALTCLALTCLALAFCAEEPAAPAPSAPPPQAEDRLENDNLLNIVFGATVLDRSYELNYEASVVQSIDGTKHTGWSSAPGGRMEATFALAAPTRLTRLGASVPRDRTLAPERLRFETSLDAVHWRRALETDLRFEHTEPQFFDIAPTDARYLRVTAIEPRDYYSSIFSLHAIGRETAPFVQPPIEGCWEINHEPARFERRGARVTGTIGGDMVVDGGSDGRVYRLTWLENAMWGFAAISVSPDGQRLSGLRWHEEVDFEFNGDGWMGKRVPCIADTLVCGGQECPPNKIVDDLIRRTAKWRLYGVRFDRDDRLMPAESANALDFLHQLVRDHPRHRFVLVAREYRATPAQNRARCETKLNAMREALRARGTDLSRIEFANAGPERHELSADFTSQRAMDSAVELQVLPLQ